MEKNEIKILAVDDNFDNLITIQALIFEAFPDAKIHLATSGKEALELAVTENPDVILLDIIMPEMDGFEVCQRLKSNKNLRDIPVVFVTALQDGKESRIRGLEVGAEAFLAKPIDETELVAQIRAMVKIRHANIERTDEKQRLEALVNEQTKELKVANKVTLNLLEDLRAEIETRKETEIALRESEQKFRDTVDLLPQVVFEINLSGELTYVNRHVKTLFGYEPEELIGKNSLIAHIPEERQRVIEGIHKKVLGVKISNINFNMLRKDGTVFPAIIYINVIRNGNLPVGLRGLVVDISEQKFAEAKIRESEEKYRELMEYSPQGIMVYVEGKIAYVNNASLRLMRADHKEQLMGKSIVEFIHPKNREIVLERMKQVAMAPINSILPSVEEEYVRLDGAVIDVEIQVMPIVFDGKPAVQLVGHDISVRKKVENELEKNRTELKAIYDNAPVMMCLINEKCEIQFANKAFTDFTGFTGNDDNNRVLGNIIGCIQAFEDEKGCGFSDSCVHCSLRTGIENTYSLLSGVNNIEYTTTVERHGILTEVHLLGSTAVIESSDKMNILLCLHDITDRKAAEDALHKSEILLRTFIENSPFEIWARDAYNVGILENKKLIEHSGSIIGTTPQEHLQIDEETRQLWERNNLRVFAGEIIDEECEYMINGKVTFFQQIVFPIISNGKLLGIAGFNIDISERKNAETKILENSKRLEMAMQIANMTWWEIDLKTSIVTFGKRQTGMLGFSLENFTSSHDFMRLLHPDDCEKTMQALRDHINGTNDKYEKEYRVVTISGEYKWFYDVGSVSKRDTDGKPLIISGLVVDITERKVFEKELSNQKQFFEQMFMQSSLSTQILDNEGWCERINPKLSQLFGVEAKNIEGHVYNIFNDEEIKRNGIAPKLKNVFEKGETAEWEVYYDIAAAAKSQQIEITENKRAWFSNWAYPILYPNGTISHVIIQHTDITEHKLAEQALRESQVLLKKFASHLQNVREEERMVLAREIHDELGQILVAVKIDLGMLKRELLKQPFAPHSNDVLQKFDNLVCLVDSTIKTARKIMTDLRPEVLELMGFSEAVKLHVSNFGERYKIKATYDNSFGELDIDSQQAIALFRIIQEALNNVAKHAQATKVRIDLFHTEGNLVLKILDNGIGIDGSKSKKSDSYGLVGMGERVFLLGGELTISGEINQGTCIQVKVPYDIQKLLP